MQKYHYKTFIIEKVRERDIDRDVGPELDNWQEDGYEYVSGPTLTETGSYLFLVRQKVRRKSTYESGDLQSI